MRLTKNLKAAIVRQFKDGAQMDYLAALYKQPIRRVEQTIRARLIEVDHVGAIHESPTLLAETSNFEPRTSNEAPDA